MKITVTDGKKYLALFIVFSFFLCVFLGALVILGTRNTSPPEETSTEESDSDKASDGVVVVIDAGHGGEDGGTVGKNGVFEKDLNLAVAFALSDALERKGITTLLTRDEDILLYDRNSNYQGQKKAQDLAERRRIAESCENAIFVSIHMNSFPEEKYKGLQVYYSENHEQSHVLAQKIQSAVSKELQPENDRQCKSGTDIYLLERLTCPSVLIECGFLSNHEECELLSTEKYQKTLSELMAKAIYEHILSVQQ